MSPTVWEQLLETNRLDEFVVFVDPQTHDGASPLWIEQQDPSLLSPRTRPLRSPRYVPHTASITLEALGKKIRHLRTRSLYATASQTANVDHKP